MIPAIYRTPEVPEHRGNPLIEALPPILSAMDTLDMLTSLPKWSHEERTHPEHLRLHYLDRLFDIVQAQPEHLKVANIISRLIRHGYKSRNPLLPAHAYHAYQLATKELSTVRPPPHFAKCRSGAYMTGLSGIGKSTIVERALTTGYPQTLVHERFGDRQFTQTQIVWLKIDCPHDGSQKQLCLNFFSAVDEALGRTTDYFDQYVSKRGGSESLVPVMHRLSHSYHIGLLVLDELQHLTTAPRGGETKTLNLLVNIMNNIGMPVFMMGTFESAGLFSKTFRNARRVAFAGPIIMDRYAKNDPRWRFFLETLWHYQWTKNPVPLDDDMADAMHDASLGVIDVAVAVYMVRQEIAITGGEEKFSSDDVRKTVPEHLTILQPALDALRRGDVKAYEQFRELLPPAEQWRRAALDTGSDKFQDLKATLDALIKIQAERLQASAGTAEAATGSETGGEPDLSREADPPGLGKTTERHEAPGASSLPDIESHTLRSAIRNK